jgi:hypothetical protein
MKRDLTLSESPLPSRCGLHRSADFRVRIHHEGHNYTLNPTTRTNAPSQILGAP